MITRHYKRIVKDILQRGGAKYDAYAVTASDGRPYYTAQEQPNYSADQTAMSMSTDQPGVIIGSGTAEESETSYWLQQQITSGFSGSVLPTHEMVDGTHTLCLYVTIANTGSSSITISEIGYALITPLMRRPSDSQYIGSPYPIEKNILIDRTVLASPITIAAGNSVRLKYALKTTDELFSGSVVLIQKTINANGVYNASSDNANGYSEVTVSVTPTLQSKTVTQNGTVTPDQGYDGLSSVVVNVSGGGSSRIYLVDPDFLLAAYNNNGSNRYVRYNNGCMPAVWMSRFQNDNVTFGINGTTPYVRVGRSNNKVIQFGVKIPASCQTLYLDIAADASGQSYPVSTLNIVDALGLTGYYSGNWSGNTLKSFKLTDETVPDVQEGLILTRTSATVVPRQVAEIDLSGVSVDSYFTYFGCRSYFDIYGIWAE